MKILLRYFLKEFFKFFIVGLLTITASLLVIEFFDKVDDFYTKTPINPPVYLVLQYFMLQIPKSLIIASPVVSLLSVLFTIGIASKWKETVAIRASGGSLKKLFSSFLILGIIISLFVLFFGETLAPMAARKALWVKNVKILKKTPKITYKEGVLWLKGLDGSLIRIRDFVEDKNRVLKVSIFNFNPSFKLIERIEAEEAEWTDGKWELKNVTVFDFDRNITARHKTVDFAGLEEPKIFQEEMRRPEEMTFVELYAYYKRLERAGFKNNRYVIELYGKLANPLVNFVMILFGIAIALNSRVGGGMRAAGLGLLVVGAYFVIILVSTSLGNMGTLPPFLVPWVNPVVFGIAGCYMFLRIKE